MKKFRETFYFAKMVVLFCCSSILLSACGGSSDGVSATDTGGTTSVTLSGTAATGAAIANETIIIKDFQDVSATGSTDANGKFTIELSSDMQPPFLLRVSDGTGGYLYSIISTTGSGTVNIHPYSDLAVRCLFDVENTDIDTAFDMLLQNGPSLSEDEINVTKQAVKEFISLSLTNQGINAEDFDIIKTSFDANGSGFDALLDNSTFTDINGDTQIVITDNTTNVTQTSNLSIDPNSGSITVTTQVTDGVSTSTSYASTTIILPEGSAVDAAVSGVNATLNSLLSTVNSQGTSLSVNDILSFYHSNYYDNGNYATQDATGFVEYFGGGISFEQFIIDHVVAYDDNNKEITAMINATTSDGRAENFEGYFKLEGSNWLIFGNQEEYDVRAGSYMEKTYNAGQTTLSKVLNIEARSGQDIFVSGTVTGGGYNNEPMPYFLALDDYQIYFRDDTLNDFLAAGTAFNITITTTNGTDTRVAYSNSTTNESFEMSGPTGHTLNDAALGGTLTANWTLPTTFPIERIRVNAAFHNASGDRIDVDGNESLSSTSTTSTIDMPSQVSGQSVILVWVRVNIYGINGEKTVTDWRFQ